MNPHDRLARDCRAIPPSFRKLRCAAEWLLIGLVLLAATWMYGYCQQADERAAIVAQSK